MKRIPSWEDGQVPLKWGGYTFDIGPTFLMMDFIVKEVFEKAAFREKILGMLEKKAGLEDLREQIEVEKIISPKDWEEDFNIYQGATFNLAHNIGQMLYFRPHNKFEDFDRAYLVGGGTHPGSGLPTILQSAMISSDLISERDRRDGRG